MQLTRPVTIHLVKNDRGHAGLIERCLRCAHVTNDIIVMYDGQDTVDHLCGGRTDVEAHFETRTKWGAGYT